MKTVILAAIVAMATPATAQQPSTRVVPESPTGFGGIIVSTAVDAVMLREKDGSVVTIPMAPGWTVARARADTAAGIRPGDFIASIQTDIDADTGRANEVRVFEPGYRPEIGTHAMPIAGQSITHGLVESNAAAADGGRTLVVGYAGGRRTIAVPAGTRVTRFDPLPGATAVQGTAVGGVTRRDADGIRRAGRLVLAAP